MKKLTVGSCFSGIGGLELGLEWTGGFETKWQIEIDPYATKVLEKHWPGVERFSDITTVAHPPAVDVICGGFPCQDVSLAGARAGLEGKRSTLWSELFRLVCEVRPRWLLAENVPGLLSSDGGRFFGNILRDLADVGFDAEWGVRSAAGVGSVHWRRRFFLLAHPNGSTESTEADRGREVARLSGAPIRGDTTASVAVHAADPCRFNESAGQVLLRRESDAERTDGDDPHADSFGLQWRREEWARFRTQASPQEALRRHISTPVVCGVDDGIPNRAHRLRCLGNAVVPQVAQKVGEMILEYERNKS